MTLARFAILLLVALLPAACASGPQTDTGTPERAVEDSFLGFRDAVLAGEGARAADLATAASWEFYRDMADEALIAGRGRLEGMSLDRQLVVLALRHDLSPVELTRMSGRELMAYWIDEGWIWIEEGHVDRDTLATAWPEGYRILGSAAAAHTDSRLYWPGDRGVTFRYEREAWRVHFLHQEGERNALAEALIAYFRIGKYKSKDEYIYATLERVTGRAPDPSIWNPPI